MHQSAAHLLTAFLVAVATTTTQDNEPPALDPFGPRQTTPEDAVPGYIELSDGTVHPGQIYLTRDHKLRILDAKLDRQREVPLRAMRRLDCKVSREWLEKKWRFKENANDEKVYTGRSYPAREYVHVITLKDGRKLEGPLAAIVYVQGSTTESAERFLLHKRDKGEPDMKLPSLLYVRAICIGEKALADGQAKRASGIKKKPPGR